MSLPLCLGWDDYGAVSLRIKYYLLNAGKKMLESQAPLDIAQLLNCITKIQQDNQKLEVELQELTSRRDHLVSINARLALPASSSASMAPFSAAAAAAPLTKMPASSLPSGQ